MQEGSAARPDLQRESPSSLLSQQGHRAVHPGQPPRHGVRRPAGRPAHGPQLGPRHVPRGHDAGQRPAVRPAASVRVLHRRKAERDDRLGAAEGVEVSRVQSRVSRVRESRAGEQCERRRAVGTGTGVRSLRPSALGSRLSAFPGLADVSRRRAAHGIDRDHRAGRCRRLVERPGRPQGLRAGRGRRQGLCRAGRRTSGRLPGRPRRSAAVAVHRGGADRLAAHLACGHGPVRFRRRLRVLPAGRRRSLGVAIPGGAAGPLDRRLWPIGIRLAGARQRAGAGWHGVFCGRKIVPAGRRHPTGRPRRRHGPAPLRTVVGRSGLQAGRLRRELRAADGLAAGYLDERRDDDLDA